MQDVNKKKRDDIWGAIVLFIIFVGVTYLMEKPPVTEDELYTIPGLVLSQDASVSRNKGAAIEMRLQKSDQTLVIRSDEQACLRKQEVLDNCKELDTVTIKVHRLDKDFFYDTASSGEQRIYGLNKNGREFIDLDCRNTAYATGYKALRQATIACIAVGVVLLFVFRSATKKIIIWKKEVDPYLIIVVSWFILITLLAYIYLV